MNIQPVLADMSMRRDAGTFFAWASAALPRAFPGPQLPLAALQAAWALAGVDIAARLALACARERLVPASLAGDALLLRPAGRAPLTLPLRRRGGFGLHRPDLDAAREPGLAEPLALLAALAPDLALEPGVLARIAAELADSRFHLAMARAVAELRLRARLAGRAWPAPLDPENLVIAGHPWHPMCKVRLGLHLHEVLRFAPEGLAAAEVHAIELALPLAWSSPDFSDMSREIFGPAPAGWLRVPAHALQRRRLPRLLAGWWGHSVRPVDVAPRPARALLSLRTVALGDLHLKLAADLHTTSAPRQVSPMSAQNGPEVGALLARIAAADPQAGRGLQLQAEPAAAGLDPAAPGIGPRAGQLGVILRNNLGAPARTLARAAGLPGEPEVWVCAALGERWPGETTELHAHVPSDMSHPPAASPRQDRALERSPLLLHRREGDTLLRAIAAAYPSPAAALRHYVELLVPPALRLCAAHGVALELHLQNTLVVHRRGRLCGFIARDLGGIRLHRGRLLAAGHRPAFAPGSFVVTEDLGEMQTKLAHTLFHAHLGSVFGWAADALGADEAALWAHTRAVLSAALDAWGAAEPQLRAACEADRAVFLAPTVRAKALLRMRIDERVSDYAYTKVDSPLGA